MRYFNVDAYHYFIGREDQSVNEKVMMGRMDQQLRVTRQMIDNVDPQAVRNRHLRHYLRNYLSMMMCICSVFLRMRGGETDEQDLKDIWAYLKEQNPSLYRRVRSERAESGHESRPRRPARRSDSRATRSPRKSSSLINVVCSRYRVPEGRGGRGSGRR